MLRYMFLNIQNRYQRKFPCRLLSKCLYSLSRYYHKFQSMYHYRLLNSQYRWLNSCQNRFLYSQSRYLNNFHYSYQNMYLYIQHRYHHRFLCRLLYNYQYMCLHKFLNKCLHSHYMMYDLLIVLYMLNYSWYRCLNRFLYIQNRWLNMYPRRCQRNLLNNHYIRRYNYLHRCLRKFLNSLYMCLNTFLYMFQSIQNIQYNYPSNCPCKFLNNQYRFLNRCLSRLYCRCLNSWYMFHYSYQNNLYIHQYRLFYKFLYSHLHKCLCKYLYTLRNIHHRLHYLYSRQHMILHKFRCNHYRCQCRLLNSQYSFHYS